MKRILCCVVCVLMFSSPVCAATEVRVEASGEFRGAAVTITFAGVLSELVEGGYMTVSAVIGAAPVDQFQWFLDDVEIVGAQESTLVFGDSLVSRDEPYVLRVDVSYGEVISSAEVSFVVVPSGSTRVFIATDIVVPGGSEAVWADHDQDGDQDLAIAVANTYDNKYPQVFHNNSGSFTDSGSTFAGSSDCDLAWGDYDNDGDVDLAMSAGGMSRIYRNTAGSFTDSGIPLMHAAWGAVDWGDYDNDGDLDLVLTGNDLTGVADVYRNDSGTLTRINAGLVGVWDGDVAWGDFDGDGDLDIVIAGRDTETTAVTRLYRNDNGAFVAQGTTVPAVWHASLDWGDYDADGDIDLLIAGRSSAGTLTRVYRNTGGVLTDVNAGLPGLFICSARWGDYDNDGDLDIAGAGWGPDGRFAGIFNNDGGVFTNIDAELTGVENCAVAWGDYDSDGDSDLVVTGRTDSGYLTRIYENVIV